MVTNVFTVIGVSGDIGYILNPSDPVCYVSEVFGPIVVLDKDIWLPM